LQLCCKLRAFKGLAETPVGRGSIQGCGGSAIASGDAEGDGLPDQHRVSLPVHAPIARHRLPYAAIAALELHGSDISFAPDVGDEHQVEVLVAIDREANASILHAWDPDTNKQTAKKHKLP